MSFTIGRREDVETYRMRSVPGGYPGDLVRRHTREINGKRFEFARVEWGTGEVTVTVSPERTTEILHDFQSSK